ncbi:twin-arginine translocase TatA/TatE family subunit [Adlercreutzia sp. ZJ304]|uniref:twin-arginine translocase TatA/TatE family subunit n=1 Tax=Adlercreutzia sp. ZJ304 TaxID=2709791 RepID=UPI0013EC3D1D|nr:twin-arginine translocase TatA/TatE family subunit [Adlercreutzia sp. ZJ304]
MFGIGGFELFLILLFGFLIFGPDKLPEIAKTVGHAIAKFRNAQEEMKGTLSTQSFIDKDSDAPLKNPLEVIEQAANEAQSKTRTAQAAVSDATDKAAEKLSEKSVSFAERKAKYDRERAERKAAEAAAAEAAKAQESAEKAGVSEEKVSDAKQDPKTDVAVKTATSVTDATSTKSAQSIEEVAK